MLDLQSLVAVPHMHVCLCYGCVCAAQIRANFFPFGLTKGEKEAKAEKVAAAAAASNKKGGVDGMPSPTKKKSKWRAERVRGGRRWSCNALDMCVCMHVCVHESANVCTCLCCGQAVGAGELGILALVIMVVVCVSVCVCASVFEQVCVCACVCTCVCEHVCMCVHTCGAGWGRVGVCICICEYVCVLCVLLQHGTKHDRWQLEIVQEVKERRASHTTGIYQ